MKYGYQKIWRGSNGEVFFRIHDTQDRAIGQSNVEENAALIVAALNAQAGDWTCGHTAGAACAQCHAELIAKANGLAAELNDRGAA